MRSGKWIQLTALVSMGRFWRMMIRVLFIAMALLLFFLGSSLSAEPFEKRNRLELKIGSWNHVPGFAPEASAEGATSASEISGMLIGLTYGRQTKEWGELTADINWMKADNENEYTDVMGGKVETSLIWSFLIGLKAYFPKSLYYSPVKPYAKCAAGLYTRYQTMGAFSETSEGDDRSSTSLGGQIGGGIDFQVGRRFMTSLSFSYNLISDFRSSINDGENNSGPLFSLGVSYIFDNDQSGFHYASSKCKTPGQQAALEIFHISTGEQREELRSLTSPDEVSQFLDEFWQRLDPTPGTSKNEYKELYYKRYDYANSHFNEANVDGSRTDRGRIYILHGPPDDIIYRNMLQHNMIEDISWSIEIWQYHVPTDRAKTTREYFDIDGTCKTFIFADCYGTGAYTQMFSTEADEIDDARFIQMFE